MSDNNKKYSEFNLDRDKFTDLILQSDSKKIIIIAGPGTGKTYLFQKICSNNIQNGKTKNLALSFINDLVNDLSEVLYKLAEVRTLHSFALGSLPGNNKFYMDLCSIIEEDYLILNETSIDYKYILCNMLDAEAELNFYSKRRKYYNFVGPDCSIYALVIWWQTNIDRIPVFSQVLIDEYQDFNRLEVSLIDLLSIKSPVLIVGDDDQSLYDFKYANPDDIRSKCKDGSYNQFSLPYCSRCTNVIINAFDSIILKAKESGYLQSRVDKPFLYFASKERDKISSENPKIIVKKKVYDRTVAYNIEQEIMKLYNPKKSSIDVLIICPIKLKIADISLKLRKKGFSNIQSPSNYKKEQLIEGFNLLIDDKDSNLGWRIVSKNLITTEETQNFKDIIKKSYENPDKIKFKVLLKKTFPELVRYICSIRSILNKINSNKIIDDDECQKVIDCLHYNPFDLFTERLKFDLNYINFPKNIYSKIPIRITTILGSKGLTYDYVFLVNFDDKYLLYNNKTIEVTDENICNFLVSLTRAKKRVYIFTGENENPTFVKWMDKTLYEEV